MFMETLSAFEDAHRIRPADALSTAAPADPLTGFAADTLVETREGWKPVRDVCTGEAVYTADGGLRAVVDTERAIIRGGYSTGLSEIHVPAGALNNCTALTLMPDQHLLIDHPFVETLLHLPFVLVRAADLVGHRGIRREFTSDLDVIRLVFREEEIVYANTGALLHCPGLGAQPLEISDSFFKRLDKSRTDALMQLVRRDADMTCDDLREMLRAA